MEDTVVLIQISVSALFMVISNVTFNKGYGIGAIITANISAAIMAVIAFDSASIVTLLTIITSAVALFIAITVAFLAEKGFKIFSIIYYILIISTLTLLFV